MNTSGDGSPATTDVSFWPDSEVLENLDDFRLLRYCGLVLLTRLSHFDCHPSETSAVMSTVME
jgi:hypothetical protein